MSQETAVPAFDILTPELQAALAGRTRSPLNVLTEAERAALDAVWAQPTETPAKYRARLRQHHKRLKSLAEQGAAKAYLPKPPKYFGLPVYIGFDAEWVTLPDGPSNWRNEVLCVTAVLMCGGRSTEYIFRPKGPHREHRPTMAGFTQAVIRKALTERVIPSIPGSVVYFGHFMRGDLASFSDFFARKREFRGLGKTVVSGRSGHGLSIDAALFDGENDDNTISRSQALFLRNLNGGQFRVSARFIDTIKLTPGGQGLAHCAAMIGMKKLDLHRDLGVPAVEAAERPECAGLGLPSHYGIDRMDLVARDYREEFEQYAIHDARVAVVYGMWAEKIAIEQMELSRLPSTIAGCAAQLVQRLAGGSTELSRNLGRGTVSQQQFDVRSRAYRTQKSVVPLPGLDMFYSLARNCYHGGRNECFYHGPTEVGMWYDFDLIGAYTTAMAALRPVNHASGRQVLDPDEYGIDDMGLAWVAFEFPPGTRFPCIPVRGPKDELVWPLAGSQEDGVYVAAPEIWLARRMGASVTIIQGFKFSWLSDERIFEPYTRLVQAKRREFPKATHAAMNEFWKEVGNSAYGLMAQGLGAKRTFDPESMRSQPIGPSPLTEPFLAAWVTSFVRAVLGEILAGVPVGSVVVSATTDGLLTDVPLDGLRLDGPLCCYYADIRERLFGERDVLDRAPKHAARQVISVAVRTTFTALPAVGYELVLAKGSVSPPMRVRAAQNRYMRKLYIGQFIGMTVPSEAFISAREQLTRETDLYRVKRERRLHLRYDHKRRPVRPRMVRLGWRTERVAFDTEPWPTIAQSTFTRERAEGWSRGRGKVMVGMADYLDWEAYREASWAVREACRAAGGGLLQVRDDNAQGLLKRAFLQAGRHGEWGVKFGRGEATVVANALTLAGYPTTKEDITYAGRRKATLIKHHVPWLPETRALLKVILELCPGFEFEKAFAGADPLTAAVDSPPVASLPETNALRAAEGQ